MQCYEFNAMNNMLGMQSNKMIAMSDSMIAIAAGRNLAIFWFLCLYVRPLCSFIGPSHPS